MKYKLFLASLTLFTIFTVGISEATNVPGDQSESEGNWASIDEILDQREQEANQNTAILTLDNIIINLSFTAPEARVARAKSYRYHNLDAQVRRELEHLITRLTSNPMDLPVPNIRFD